MMHYRYTFLLVEACEEKVYYDLTPEGIYEVMQNPDAVLSSIEKVGSID